MNFPPETSLRLARKGLLESMGKMAEARAVAAVSAGDDTLKAIDRVMSHTADVVLHIDLQIRIMERRQPA